MTLRSTRRISSGASLPVRNAEVFLPFAGRIYEALRRRGETGLRGDAFLRTERFIQQCGTGQKTVIEEHGESDKQIYVFNSRSASVGETLIGMKIRECEEQGLDSTAR